MRAVTWRWVCGAAMLLAATGLGARASAQLAPAAELVRAHATFMYREGGRTRVLLREGDGSLWLLAHGRRFRAELGNDRVIVVGRGGMPALAGLDVEVVEVLSAHVGIVAVRSTRVGEGALALAARLAAAVAAGRIDAASPDLAFEHVLHDIAVPPDDPRLGEQWFFEAIGIEDAWARQDGDPSVTIAVIDNGCDIRHRDLAEHMLVGYDALDAEHEPTPRDGGPGYEHGTACAGLAAAVTDNGLDVAGACPECSIRCIRLIDGASRMVQMSADVRAFEFVIDHDDIAVVSNSWGYPAGFPVPLALERLIERVLVGGRGGRGALVVFAAGNDGAVLGADELPAIPGVIAVGAIEPSGERVWYSNSGQCLAVVAPLGTVTTDVTGNDGAGPGTVTTSFSGTSSACPIVAGVLGLMVSAAPDLSGEALRDVLVESARRSPFARPDARGHDPEYGYGVVDPAAALDELWRDLDAGTPEPRDADVEPLDARRVPRDVGPVMRSPGPCACRAGGARPPDAALAILSLALLAVLVARRARRVRIPGARGGRRPRRVRDTLPT